MDLSPAPLPLPKVKTGLSAGLLGASATARAATARSSRNADPAFLALRGGSEERVGGAPAVAGARARLRGTGPQAGSACGEGKAWRFAVGGGTALSLR